MNPRKKVLIIGATGQVGGAVIPYLRDEPSLEVIAAARNPAKAVSLGIGVVYMDLDKPDSIRSAMSGIDQVFFVTGYTVDMLRQSKDVTNAAVKNGVEQMVHLGACGDDDTPVAHYGWHQFIERYIASSGIRYYTHLRPEMYMQNLFGYGGSSFIENGVLHQYIGQARLSWVDCEDVAAVAAAALVNPARHHQKTYRMGYEAKSYSEVAQMLTEIVGQPFRYEPRPPEEFLKEVLAAGAEPAYMKCVYECYRDFGLKKLVGDEVFDNLPSIIGRSPKTLSGLIKNNVDKFRY